LSFGWNFFKTSVYFFTEKEGTFGILRKDLKRSHEYSICFRGPDCFDETGLVGCLKIISGFSLKERGSFFNILFTGKVSISRFFGKVFKKIIIEGVSFKIHNKTAYIKNMFSNEIEVRRFVGNQIFGEKGEKGIIKNPIRGIGSGVFRATFDRKIGLKKKIFLRIWVPLKFNDKVFKNNTFTKSHDEREIDRIFSFQISTK
jgi:ribosome biogenesis protein BMS1